MRRCLKRDRPGPYQIQAAINAVHCDAPIAAATDWSQILRLYDHLLAIAPTPVAALNRAVAAAQIDGPQVALGQVDSLELDGFHVYHVVRADLLRRLGRTEDAVRAYHSAIALTQNAAERDFLARKACELG